MIEPQIITSTLSSPFNVNEFKKKNPVWEVRDIYQAQLKELFEITHAHLVQKKTFQAELESYLLQKKEQEKQGNWVYFPWSGELVHMLEMHEYNLLRTNRNQLLIKPDEQQRLLDFSVGILGLSVGSHVASALAWSGISNKMRLADFDTLETSNLNRIRAGVTAIGQRKMDVCSRELFELNPYLELDNLDEGINEENIETLFIGNFPIQAIYEVIDDFKMKIKVRLEAKKRRIPVIMLTSLGDGILIDVERYDLDQELPLFNGLIGNLADEILEKPLSEEIKKELAVKLVERKHVPDRAIDSLKEINNTLVGRPQLYSTVTIAGGIAGYLIRMIALGEPVPSGRTFINFNQFLP